MVLTLVVALPLVAALLLTLLAGRGATPGPASRDLAVGIALAGALGAAGLLFMLAPAVLAGHVAAVSVPWLPWRGADLGLRLDGLGLLFGGLVTVIGALVVFYARYYLAPDEPVARFMAVFMAFMAAMLGLVLADNLLLLAICWELTSLASFLLIGHWRERGDARRGARTSLLVTGLGGLALLAGVLLLGQISGSFKLDVVLDAGTSVRADPAYPVALGLVLLGVFTKSAQFPWHFWLPEAMAAPTPASAFLHSATLVKAGIFLLARLHPVLAGTDLWFWLVGGTGLVTLLGGAYLAVFQHDLKGLLAYSTISHLGLITLLFGLDEPLATVAALFHALNHATFKASLFMAAGAIDHETGSRDMRRLNGLWRLMPVTGVLAITSSLAMAGVPLLNGFLSKEMFFAETLLLERSLPIQVAVPLLATLATAFSVAYSARFVHDVFWNGEPRDLGRVPHDPPRWMLVPIGVLALVCVLVGLLPQLLVGPLLAAAAEAAIHGPLPAYTLSVWHGFNLPLMMSAVALVMGVIFYVFLQRLFRLHDLMHLPRGGRELLAGLLRALDRLAGWLDRRLLAATLRRSVLAVLVVALLAGTWPLLGGGLLADAGPMAATGGAGSGPTLAGSVAWLLTVLACGALLAWHRDRLTAVVLVGAIGLMVTLAFAGLAAPDLALTQLLVEVVSVILLLLALNFLPATSPSGEPAGRRVRDGVLAAAAGLGVSALAFGLLTRPGQSIAGWYLENAVPGAAGTNAVNVIIVDFRALDTLGEITVLGIAGLLVGSALAGWRPNSRVTPQPARAFLLEPVVQLLLPLMLSVSLFLFLRGHNLPGGGFVGGLVAATGVLLLYIAHGTDWVESRWRASHQAVIALGLLAATLTGAASLLVSHPFLTSTYLAPVLPVIGKVPLASALGFDLGVLLTVLGATLLAVVTLGRLGGEPATGQERAS